jgi:hypothetical protein
VASIFRRGGVWWIKYYLRGIPVQESLHTPSERVALDHKRQTEYKLSTHTLVLPTETPVAEFLEDYCHYLEGIRTRKSYKNDVSYLRLFFGPVCPALKPGNTCNRKKRLQKEKPKVLDPLKGRHVAVWRPGPS